MVAQNDKIGVVRDHRWVKAVEQHRRLEAEGCRGIVEIDGKKNPVHQSDIIKMACPGRVFALAHAFLLADPKGRNRRGGVKADFDAVLKALTDKGAIVKDMETGLTTETAEHRRAVMAVSYSHIARSNQGLKSALNGTRSRGRPKEWADPKDRKIIWEEWHSSEHKTNADAVKAASERLGREVSHAAMWRVVREMRREKGKPDAGGASGRLPGNPLLRSSTYRKRRVYFALCGGRLKIGVATTVSGRIGALQNGNPEEVKLLTCVPGDEELEARLHKRFAKLHVRGEWFRYEGALLEYVQSLPKRKN